MAEEEFVAKYPWVTPDARGGSFEPRAGVHRASGHIAVRAGAAHKSIAFMEPIHSKHLEHVDGHDWEIFGISHKGEVDGRAYYWGMFVEGLGAFNVMVPVEHARALLPPEREAWSKVTLGMYGSHSGNLSYTLPSDVSPSA